MHFSNSISCKPSRHEGAHASKEIKYRIVCKPNTDFVCVRKLSSRQNYLCFPFFPKVLLKNMDDATTVLLRKSFQGYIIHVCPALQSRFFARILVSFHVLFYLNQIAFVQKNETFQDSQRYVHAEKMSTEIFHLCHCSCTMLFSVILHELLLQCPATLTQYANAHLTPLTKLSSLDQSVFETKMKHFIVFVFYKASYRGKT